VGVLQILTVGEGLLRTDSGVEESEALVGFADDAGGLDLVGVEGARACEAGMGFFGPVGDHGGLSLPLNEIQIQSFARQDVDGSFTKRERRGGARRGGCRRQSGRGLRARN